MKTIFTFAISLLLLSNQMLSAENYTVNSNEGKKLAPAPVIMMALPAIEEESYINDIPFDTEAVALNSLFMNLVRPDEEAYINDIPMDTEEISTLFGYSALNIRPDDEAYINDIPFDTAEVVKNFLKRGE